MNKLILLFCILGSLAVVQSQNEDTSQEEALLDELLSESPEEESAHSPVMQNEELPIPDAPPEPYDEIPATLSQPETNPPLQEQESTTIPETPSYKFSSSPDIAPSDNSRDVGTQTYSASPEISEEARIQESPEIPNFSHQDHIEGVGAECVQCHQTLFAESVRGIKSGPSMKEICSQCHNGSDAPSELLAGFTDEKKYVRTYMPLFSHTTHMEHTEKCIVCHDDIYGKMKEIEVPPPMNRCSGCHNDQRANADCKACHEHPERLKPKSHTSRWVYRNGHGKMSRLNKKECSACHTDRQCSACHKGQTTFEVHRPGYKFSHGMDARQRIVNCGYCHDAKFSCTQCHVRRR